MSKKMMVNATHEEENRVAIVEDGILTELDIEVAGREPTKGNIYKAVVVRVETGLQAAFVDYGAERLGFLQIDEINFKSVKPDYQSGDENRRPRINDLLHRGQELLVQITKEERDNKGAALTTYLSLAGRYMVLMPGSQTRGVSRKAESDSQRKELKKAMASLDLAEGIGYIVRTAALDQTREELDRDYRYLLRLYESIKELERKSKAPALIYKESNLMIRSIRDYFTTEMDEVLIDDPEVFKEAKDFFLMVMPDHVNLVKLHQERRPIFSRYQIEDQIETLSRNKVMLPSGGSIVIDPTEALVAIDVNSGKMASEQNVEATATKTNLEAASEVGRQLRLRDLGGLIVIDFIDMRERKNMRQVENQLKKSLENDKARVSVGRISKFGLIEMSRQRIKATLTQGSYLTCPHCNGSGHLKSPETQAVALLRKIHASAAKGQVSRVDAQLPAEVASYLLNHNRQELVEMEQRYRLQIHLHGNRDFHADQLEIEIQKKEKEKVSQPEFVAAGSILPMEEPEKKPDTIEPVQQESGEAEAEGGKKRRRRRRRKPATDATSVTAETQSTGQDGKEGASQTDQPTTVETTAPAADSTSEQADSELQAKKPQRRRRSRSKAKTEQPSSDDLEGSNMSVSAAPSPESSATQTEENSDSPAVEQPSETSRPKRRRSRRKPRTAEVATEESPVATQPESLRTEETPPATDQAKTEAKPKPKRPRRTAKKPAAAATPASDTAQDVATTEPPAPSKPARRSRSTKAKTPSVAETASTESATPDMATSSQSTPKQAEKPKQRRPRQSKPKTEDAGQEQKETSDIQPSLSAEPAKKRPARRPRKKPVTDPVDTSKGDSDTSPVMSEGPSGETTDKPKRRRTVRKKATQEKPAAHE